MLGPGPTPPTERALAPDLARGAMLLFIAVANAANVAAAGPPYDPHPHGVERVLNTLMAVFVDARAYPVFAVMFGYGLVQLARRRDAVAGDAATVLVRRNAWLVVFGLVHATVLYFGDFLGAYGIVGVVATVVLLRRGERFHRLVLWLWAAQLVEVVVLGWLAVSGWRTGPQAGIVADRIASLSATDYGRSVLDRLAEWPAHTASVLGFIVIVWLGMWAGRRRLLEDPAAHRRLLQITAAVAGTVMIVGALPYAAVAGGWVHVDPATMPLLTTLHGASGEYGGPAYIAVLGLFVARRRSGASRVVSALACLGRRSLSGYLFQSVAWLALLSPVGLALAGPDRSMAVAVVTGALVWVGSVLAASWFEARGRPGPAEALLRRLTYGRRGRHLR